MGVWKYGNGNMEVWEWKYGMGVWEYRNGIGVWEYRNGRMGIQE